MKQKVQEEKLKKTGWKVRVVIISRTGLEEYREEWVPPFNLCLQNNIEYKGYSFQEALKIQKDSKS